MAERLTIATMTLDDLFVVRLTGVIDEDSALEQATRGLPPRSVVVLDTAGVTRINSCGVRDWVNWLARLAATDHRIVLVHCSVHIVEQINMVHNFIGSGQIKGFHAPYYCEACDRELTQYLEVAELTDPLAVRPPCPSCGRPTELDHLPEQYFAFLEDRARITVDPELSRNLAQLGRSYSRSIRELDGGARQAPALAVTQPPLPPPTPRAPASEPLSPVFPAAAWPVGRVQPPSSPSLVAVPLAEPRQAPGPPPPPPPPPPSLRGSLPLRDQTGPHHPRPLGDTEPPQEAALRPWPQRPLADTEPSGPALVDDPETGRLPTLGPVVRVASPGPFTPPAGEPVLSPLATTLLVASIVVVLALMSLLLFRNW